MIINSVNADNIILNSSNSNDLKNYIENRTSGDTVTLNSSGGEFVLNSANTNIIINKTITIKSSSSSQNAVINLNKTGRAFYISSTGSLTLINITIINGNFTGGNGGAIYNTGGSAILTGCNFTNNFAGEGGGAIYNYDGRVNTNHCIFINNSITIGRNGGAIHNYYNNANFTANNCNFENNSITSQGGAIYNERGMVNLTACNFTSNKAGFGAAIYNIISGSKLYATDCIFRNNLITINGYSGAAIYNNAGLLNLTKCNFTNNNATRCAAIYNYNGGILTAKDCIFKNNFAINGSAIYNDISNVTLTNCNFIDNLADIKGGAIYNYGNNANLTLNYCIFTNNSLTLNGYFGGAIHNEGASVYLSSCNFTNNSAFRGGAINSDNGTLTVYACNFISNTGIDYTGEYGEAGAIYNSAYANLTSCNFISNKAIEYAGAVYNFMINATLIAYNCTFRSNSAGLDGGAILNNYGKINLTSCNFILNDAFDGGGAIFNTMGAILNAKSCIFTNNKAYTNGSIIYNTASATLTNCALTIYEISGVLPFYYDVTLINCTNYDKLVLEIDRILALGLSSSKYTVDTWANFYDILNKAIAINDAKSASSQEVIDGLILALNQNIGKLVPIDYSPLQEAINSALILDSSKYTPDSWAKYQAALMAVVDMYNNKNGYSQDEIKALIVALDLARSNLVHAVANENPVLPKADLTITKISKDKKKVNVRYVFIKNIGKKASGKFVLGVYIGKKLITKINVKTLKTNELRKVKVIIPKKYMTKKYKNMVKIFKLDIKKVVKESKEDNNSKKAK
jgi:predicted outer membrane repeat protein